MSRIYFERDGITIIHGDALEAMGAEPDGAYDLLLTDPPYGIGIAAKGMIGNGRPTAKMDWDKRRPTDEAFAAMRRVSSRQVIWGGNYFADLLPASRCWFVWYKRPNNKTDFADCELAWTSQNANAKVLDHVWNGARKYEPEDRYAHPTQKPLRLMRWCIEATGAGKAGPVASVFDPYLGTGTSLVAARALGIRAVGVEREERYCEMAAERVTKACDQER